jgi:hypothetical protein
MVMVVSVKRDTAEKDAKFALPPKGLFVKAKVPGKPMGKVFTIPREALREADTLWVLAENEVLDIVSVEVIRTERNQVIIAAKVNADKKLTYGDRIIVSPIAIPVIGMKLEMESSVESSAGEHLK